MVKDKMLLMFPDKRKRISGWVTFADVLFKIGLVISIIFSVIFLIGAVLYPLLWLFLVIITLGLWAMAKGSKTGFTGFTKGFLPVVLAVWFATIGLFIIKWTVEWLVILRQSYILNKDKAKNKNYIAVCGVIKKVKLINLGTCIITAIFAAVIAIVSPNADTQFLQKIFPVILIVILLAVLITTNIINKKMFKKIQPNIDAIYQSRKNS